MTVSTATLGSRIQFSRMFLQTQKIAQDRYLIARFHQTNPLAKQLHSEDVLVNRAWLTCGSAKVKDNNIEVLLSKIP